MQTPDRYEIGRQLGLSGTQVNLADTLISSKTIAPVGRREINPDGTFRIVKVERPTSPIDFPVDPDREFALNLHQRLPNAPLGKIYVNLRNLQPELLDLIGQALGEVVDTLPQPPQLWTPIPKAGTPLLVALTDARPDIRVADIMEKDESGGERKVIPSQYAHRGSHQSLGIIDDVITESDAKLQAIAASESLQYSPRLVLVVVDREQIITGKEITGADELRSKGYDVRSVFSLRSNLLPYYLKSGQISQTQHDEAIYSLIHT